ncbi:MAG: acyltransferase [Chitinophagaceae bacterium]|nr:acyltransferase [Chitinophagaceae bacterium]
MNIERENKYYYPQLDAIRGIGIVCIFFYHAYKPHFGQSLIAQISTFFYSNLYLSIDLFFVLSSFLITFLAFNEVEKNGNFSFKNYFIRRALRIWPLYYLLMLVSFVFIRLLANQMGETITLPPAAWYLFFVSNFYSEGHVFFLQQLWTLSVEEQFYIVWGLSLLFFTKK